MKEAGGLLKVRRFHLLKNVKQKPDKDHVSKLWLYFSPHLFLFHLSLLLFLLLTSPHVFEKMRRMEERAREGKQAVWE